MAAKAKPSRRDAILDAVLDIVVERGFHDAPMSLIAQRSGASAGIIYHYFSSKEEVIQALYQRVRSLQRDAFLAEFDPGLEAGAVFVQTFVSLYHFYRKHRREMRFYELCGQAGFACAPEHKSKDERAVAFAKRFSPRSVGGVLKEWPAEVLQEMTLGLVARLADQKKRIAEPVLREIAESTWAAVRG